MYALRSSGRPAVAGKAADDTFLDSGSDTSDFAELRGFYWHIKRPVGFLTSLIAALVSLPAVLIIALVLAHQGHPVFIRRQRLGLHGKPFTSYYFRTMVPNSVRALTNGGTAPVTDRFGRLLARTRADRLPLFWNVLRGDMNLVGPRPLSQEELIGSGRAARYSLSVRPGLTGLWWVNGENDLRRRLALDRSYIEHAGLALDFRIFLRTLVMMHGG